MTEPTGQDAAATAPETCATASHTPDATGSQAPATEAGETSAAGGSSEASEQAPDAPAPDAPARGDRPRTYAPDPAGTRPKVTAGSLAAPGPIPDARPDGGLDRPLGQTFRPSRVGAPVGRSPGPPPADHAKPGPVAAIVPAAESPHAPRFQFIFGALLALGLSAIALTAYTLGSSRDPVPADWSAWHPTSGGIQAAVEIGNHVSAEYRLPGAGQLLAVKGGPLSLAGLPVTILLKTGAVATGGITALPGNAVLYKMCGLGPGCSITGKASAERLTLVRREALELALYTFNYVGGTDQVVVFLPPVFRPAPVPGQPKKVKVTTDPTDAVFFRASDLASQLGHPLNTTLTEQAPSLAAIDRAPDTPLVNELTSPSFYKFSFVQTSQDAALFLVLEPAAVGN